MSDNSHDTTAAAVIEKTVNAAGSNPAPAKESTFTPYQVFIIALLTVLQFTIVLDFMVLSPLGAILLGELDITTGQFGLVVSAYAFSAGASGLLAAGFADKFDRKRLLVFFYIGFMIGTLLCAVAPNYEFLLAARIVTGLFGGVIGSISFAIITDLFAFQVRGRVMGFVQMAFAASQVLGIPIGLLLANNFGWHAPFWLIVGFGSVVAVLIAVFLKPITAHLSMAPGRSVVQHLKHVISTPRYMQAFAGTMLLATGGFMLMPFASAFTTNNVGLSLEQLPLLYGITGVFSMAFGPLIGRISDRVGKYRIFVAGSLISILMVAVYTNLGITPLWLVIALNVIMFVGISSRIISSSALLTGIPVMQDRGAFMSVNASIQQISGGIASAAAGMIVVQNADGMIEHYDSLGYVVICSILVTIVILYFVNKMVANSMQH